MRKFLTLTLLGLIVSVASFALGPITGPLSTCIGNTIYLSDSLSPGGTWMSSNTAVATINMTSGAITGLVAGTSTITYSLGGASTTAVFTVTPMPSAITGTMTVCVGSFTSLSDATAGGMWTIVSGGTGSATVDSGLVEGLAAGTAHIEYFVGTPACGVTAVVTVNSAPANYITGDSTVCAGSMITLMDVTAGGTWSSGSTSVATVTSGGVVSGVSAGAVTISYTLPPMACGTSTATYGIFVVAGSAGTITVSGGGTVVAGSTIGASSTVPGGTWSSGSTSVATVSPIGTITGVSAGTAVISYTVTSCGSPITSTYVVTVTPGVVINRISGNINFTSGTIDSSSVIKIWLITYNSTTHLLVAVDSTTTASGGWPAYYQFLSPAADSYRVKAAVYPVTFTSTGFMPTYHTSSSYWSSASVLYHTTGDDGGVDINMGYGTVTSGAGFIGGDVTTGANKGTNGGVPAVGLQIYARSSTGGILQYTYTDAAGHYTFSNLPVGTYSIYPEAINYATTPYASINLTSAAPTMSTASFIQHTVSHTITPITTGVNNVKPVVSSVTAFPNPTSGNLTLQWNETATEKATVTIADITGRELYTTTVNMTVGMGATQLDLSGLVNGVYVVSVKSGTINYNEKVQKQ